MVASVEDMSLSIDPTSPTTFKDLKGATCSAVSSCFSMSSCMRLGHSFLNISAPVRLPSPPQTTRASIPLRIWILCQSPHGYTLGHTQHTIFLAADSLPGLSLNEAHLADPIKVPPCGRYPLTSSQSACDIMSPPLTSPS
jgi:hypothetical protein